MGNRGNTLALGAMIGAFFALYLAHVAREVTLVLLAMCAIVSELSPAAHLDAVLAALAAGPSSRTSRHRAATP